MKRSKVIVLAALCLAALAFTSCDIIIRIFYVAPDVNLTGPSSLIWGEEGTYDSGISASDVSDEDLTFAWYLNDVRQTNVSSTATAVTFAQTPNRATTYTIRVEVSAGSHDPVSEEMTVAVGGPAYFSVSNETLVELYYCYFSAAGASVWEGELFGDNYHLDPDNDSSSYLFQPGNYDFQAQSYYKNTRCSLDNVALEEGMITTMHCVYPGAVPSIIASDTLNLSDNILRTRQPVFAAAVK